MTYYSWDYWQLYHKVTFDGVNKLIIVNPGVTSLDIRTDVYSDWKEWILLEDFAKYLPAIRSIGGDPIGAGLYAGDLYFLINGWKLIINLNETAVIGALFSDDYNTPFYDSQFHPLFPATVSSLVTQVRVVEGIGTPQQVADAVWSAPVTNHTIAGTFGHFLQKKLLTVAKYIGLK